MRITTALIAGVLSGCDADARRAGAAIELAPTPAPIAVSINRVFGSSAPFGGPNACAFNSVFTPIFDVVIVAVAPVRVDRVTMRLIDGSVVGGPMIPFPQPAPVIGPLIIPAGIRRTFPFRSSFACASPLPRTVTASVGFLTQAGVRQTITVDAPFR